jgi:CheY-like chemotaxis protein
MLSAAAGSLMTQARGLRTVLVVEDEILVRTAIAEYLRLAGYRIIEAANAAEAITVVDAGIEVDLVLCREL